MSVAMLITALALQSSSGEFRDLLDRGLFLEAWNHTETLDAPLRARSRAELLLRAGSPEGAYEEVAKGLQNAPADLELLFYGATAAVWLGDGELARRAANRLQAAIDQAQLSSDDEEAWKRSAHQRVEESLALLEREQGLKGAFLRFKAVSALLLAALGLTGVAVARMSVRYGKSSSPVS